ncbi:MAG: divalent cation tolerance protein CutA [Candidatus Aenigmatarchaeota archaeon]
MMTDFCNLQINAPTREEIEKIADMLIRKKLMAGCLIIKAPSKYWWDGKIVNRDYYHIRGFSMMEKKNEIIREVKKLHSDKCPVIAFINVDGNEEFLNWIKEYVE